MTAPTRPDASRRFTEAEVAAIVARVRAGDASWGRRLMGNAEQRARWRKNSANYRLRKQLNRGRCRRDPYLSADEELHVCAYYESGLTVKETALLVGATYDQVHGALQRAGITMRPRGRRRST